MSRYDIETWSCFAAFTTAVAAAKILAGTVGVCVVIILTLGLLYWADRHGYLKKEVVKKSHHDDENEGADDSNT